MPNADLLILLNSNNHGNNNFNVFKGFINSLNF